MSKPVKRPSRSYAPAPVMGAAFGSLLVLSPILLGGHIYLVFFSLAGLVIVVGGVIAVAFMSFDSEDVHKALRAIAQMFHKQEPEHDNLHRDMMAIIAWASVIKERGMRNFESLMSKNGISDPFVKYGLNMVVSEYSPDEVRDMMQTAADATYERDSIPVNVLQAMTSHAPAFGMVGTLVGMVAMLCNLSDDVTGIGSSLAVAFLSTLYGVVSARMVYMPAASKLRQDVDNRHFRNHLITEGMALLASGKAPMHIQDRLNSFLRPEVHDYFDYFNVNTKDKRPERPAVSPKLKVVNA